MLSYSIRGTAASNFPDSNFIQVNGNTGSIYTFRSLFGTGSGTGSGNGSIAYIGAMSGSTLVSNTFTSGTLSIPNYTSSSAKPFSTDVVTPNNSTTASLLLIAGLVNTTAAITSLGVFAGTGSFDSNSSFSLYGLL